MRKKLKTLPTLCAIAPFLFAASVLSVPVHKCPKNNLPIPKLVTVSNCEAQPCLLVRGKTVYINVTFDAPFDLDYFEAKILGSAFGMTIDYPLKEKRGCKMLLMGQCPLEEGERVRIGSSMNILRIYPKTNFGMEFYLTSRNEMGEKIQHSCFQIDGKIV